MPKIFSPFQGQDPLGAAMAQFGKQMFGGGNAVDPLEAEKLYDAQRTNIERDNYARRVAGGGGVQELTADPIAQAMAILGNFDAKDIGGYGLMGAATKYGATDPRTQNMQVGTGQSYDNTSDAVRAKAAEVARANDMTSANQRYSVDQSQGTERWKHNTVGADQAVDNAEVYRNNNMTSADRIYSDNLASKDRRYGTDVGAESSRYGTDQAQLTERSKFFDTPVATLQPNGAPGYARQGELAGSNNSPILSAADQTGTLLGKNFDNLGALDPMQRQVFGANPSADGKGTPKNYILNGKTFITYDGTTDAQSGQPLPPGGYVGTVQGDAAGTGITNAVNSNIQSGILANNKLSNMLAAVREVASKDPTNFGIPGFVKGIAQDTQQIAQGLAQGLGYQAPEQMLNEAIQGAAANGIDPNLLSGVFDPDLNSLQTLSDLIVYQAASALAGQSGRDLSNQDIQFFKTILGDPRELFMSQTKYLAKLTQIERVLQMNQGALGDAQQNGVTPAPGTTGGAPTAVPAPAPQAVAPPAASAAVIPPPAVGSGWSSIGAVGGPQPQMQNGSMSQGQPVVEKWGRGPDGRPVRVQ